MQQPYPILEFDADPLAMISPGKGKHPDSPERVVICFFKDVIDHFLAQGIIRKHFAMGSEMGEHPLYILPIHGQEVGLLQQAVGAPLAAGIFEEVIAHGGKKFIACGGCGVLDRSIAMGHLLLPTSAIRDEGTSYHYLAPSREVEPDPTALRVIEQVLQRHGIEYLQTKAWTTDAFYRETRGKVALRKAEGCLAVEMEAAALFAVAKFRNVQIGQILYGGDNLDGDAWDSREWNNNWSIREKLIMLAAEAVLEL